MSGFRVLLSTSAAAALGALGSRGGLLNLWVAWQVAACEVIASDRVVLVYAIRSEDVLRDTLYGERLHRTFIRRSIRRAIHGRRGRR